MDSRCSKILPFLLAAACLSALPAVSSGAEVGDRGSHWAVARFQGVVTLPLGSNHVEAWNDCGSGWIDYLSFRSSIDVNTSPGVTASFEYVLHRRYGLEVGLSYWSKIVDLRFYATGITVEGSPNFIMPSVGANYHLLTDERKDLYAGGLCALGVIATGFYTDIEVSKDIALGLNLGMDYYFGKSWSVGANAKYVDFGELNFSVLPPGMEGLVCDNGLFGIGHMNVVSLTCGIGYRF